MAPAKARVAWAIPCGASNPATFPVMRRGSSWERFCGCCIFLQRTASGRQLGAAAHILTIATFLPLLGAVVLAFMNRERPSSIRWVALIFTVLTFLVTVCLYS